jgi:tetratricopeptide (TPR) repeat protein
MRATAYKSLNMYTEAYYDYSFLIRLEHTNGTHYCSRGLCCAKLKRLALALEDLDTALEVTCCVSNLLAFYVQLL